MAFRARNVLGTFEKRVRGPRNSRTVHDQLGEPIYYYIIFFLFCSRYFSSQGWSGGPYPITIPKSLRSALQDTGDTQTGGTGAPRTSNWDSNTKRETRSLFDLVGHLCGRPVPGIPLASTLPSCPVDRVRQIHWMYCTLLTFLRYK